jgi:hypothetical protein
MRGSLILGANANISIQTKAKEQRAEKNAVVFTVLEN